MVTYRSLMHIRECLKILWQAICQSYSIVPQEKAAILILLALGVDEETAMYDYMLTNEYRKEYIESFKKDFPLTKLDGELAGMLLAYEGVTYTNADYSLKRIKEKYENYDEYFEKEYNLDKDALQRLRDLYTE